jgi:hypothetical protein
MSGDEAWLTLELTDRQILDGVLLMAYLVAIQVHSLLGWRRVCRIQRFSERNQRLYVVFSLRKVIRLLKEIVLDHMVFIACFALWAHGVLAEGIAEGEIARLQDAGVGEGDYDVPMKVGLF